MDGYTEDELKKTVLKLKDDLTEGKEKYDNKKVVILGGQPGSGKTKLIEYHNSKKRKYIIINGDDYREMHPRYKELHKEYGDKAVLNTQKFANEVSLELIKALSDEGYNLIIEGTLRTRETPLRIEKDLKEKGYETELSVVATRPEMSYLGTLKRYEEMLDVGIIPRHVPKEFHDLVVDSLLKNLETISKENKFDNITIYNRNGEKLYSLKETPEKNPKTVLEKEFKRPWKNSERTLYYTEIKEVICKMEKRNDPKLEDIKKLYKDIKKIQLKEKNKGMER